MWVVKGSRSAGLAKTSKAEQSGRTDGDDTRRAQAAGHERTRRAHAAETAEDYVEAIGDLIDGVGEARVVDLAECLGVTHVTVVRTIARLQRDGLVTARPYRSIFLTAEGARLAERARMRHRIVLGFLRALGVPEDVARADTEGIEHHVSRETLAAFERFAGLGRRMSGEDALAGLRRAKGRPAQAIAAGNEKKPRRVRRGSER